MGVVDTTPELLHAAGALRRSFGTAVVAAVLVALIPSSVQALAGDVKRYDQPFKPTALAPGLSFTLWIAEEWSTPNGPRYAIGRKQGFHPRHDFLIPGPTTRLVVDLEGNLWTATSDAAGAPVMGRVTSTGAISSVRVPEAPTSIALGADGAIYFNQPTRFAVDKIVPPFTVPFHVVEYSGAFDNMIFDNLTRGADGNVWFSWSSSVGKITPGGVISAGPTWAGLRVSGMAAVGDAIFAVMTGGGLYVTRFLPASRAITFLKPFPECGSGMAGGPDGNMWILCITQNSNGSMTRVDNAGNLRRLGLPVDCFVTFGDCGGFVYRGLDGRTLIYTEPLANRIGVFSVF